MLCSLFKGKLTLRNLIVTQNILIILQSTYGSTGYRALLAYIARA